MTATGVARLSRRSLLAGSGALLTSGCAACTLPRALGPLPSGQRSIGDVHTHMFNAADLPVAGFLENVLLPAYLTGWEPLWPALIDAAGGLKTLALPAEKERRRLAHAQLGASSGEVSPARFANQILRSIDAHAGARANAPRALRGRSTSLADSYALLARLLAAAARQPNATPGTAAIQAAPAVDRAFLERVAVSGSAAVRARVEPSALSPQLAPSLMAAQQLPSLWDGIKFVYALIQPRCSHVRQYLQSMASDETRTVRMVNLLVDYDEWLGDGPLPDSGTAEQLRFWTEYRQKALGRIAVETFAPYDPLRHAEDRLRKGNDDGYFAEVKGWAAGTSPGIGIAGFKLYPPMGFKAKGNQGEPPTDRAGAIVRRRWAANNWPIARFGEELETSLDRFFAFCGEQKVPILAHARNSNEASSGAGADANPLYWVDRAQSSPVPLRICLAHFSALRVNKPWGEEVYRRVLQYNRTGPSEIFLDLAFADDLLDGNATMLMEEIAGLCEKFDQECRWFTFGTDWIMLAQMHRVERYIPALLDAARTVPFWTGGKLDNLLHNNLDRFLRRS